MKTLSIADLFCGAGGTSTGAEEAIRLLGYRCDLTAINHWPVAIATHTVNHPDARHLCTGLDAVNPRDLYAEGELDLLWASPECTHHSIARGGKPINDQSRATAWCVIRWAEALRPNIILIENVPEFLSWGPCGKNGRPIKRKKGTVFFAWIATLEALGYRVEHRILCAADYGDHTTRRRLFIQAVRGRRKIIWPDATHAAPKYFTHEAEDTQDTFAFNNRTRAPWQAARDIIDWNLKGKSIYDRKKPLRPKTLRRIYAGLAKFGFKPFITPGMSEREKQAPRTHNVELPLPTIAATGHLHLAQPYLVELRGTKPEQVENSSRSVDQPTPTITAGGGHLGIVEPYLVQVAHGNGKDKKGDQRRNRSVDDPFPTVCGSRGEWAVCEPSLLPQQSGGALRSVADPVPTVAAAGAIGLVEPYIIPIDHTGGEKTPCNSVDDPLSTVTTEARHAVVEPFLVEYYGNGRPMSIDIPLGTVTTKQRFGIAEPVLEELIANPGKRPIIQLGDKYYLLDIRFRMLQPHELAAAMGFPPHFQFTGTGSDKVKQIGNAVPRRTVRALVLAALSQQADITPYIQPELTKAA